MFYYLFSAGIKRVVIITDIAQNSSKTRGEWRGNG
jgi:hypothetical protein